MGCTPSKPLRRPSRFPSPSTPHSTNPKEFLPTSLTTDHTPPHHGTQEYQPYRPSQRPKPHRRAAQMYETYRRLEQERDAREGRRYSWEGHVSERTFTTFESLAERGVIERRALGRK